jgi:hypothetical protein
MVKKNKEIGDELDFDPEENESFDDQADDQIDEDIEFIDDDDSIDLVIEIDETDLELDLSAKEDEAKPESDNIVLSKHTLEGKHSLKYDSIFKGKKEEPLQEGEGEGSAMYFNDTFALDKSSSYWFESVDNESYVKEKRVKEKVYEILSTHTDLNFNNNRRKPSKVDFNNYYFLLKTHLKSEGFNNVEIFNELAVYFSDNLFNMFKLLDNKWRMSIISELQDHVGKQNYSKEVMNRNIFEGTEIEFLAKDIEGNEIYVTGVVLETNYEESTYKVDSFENVYIINLSEITKILNNTKFKHNLNKLNNIDFL